MEDMSFRLAEEVAKEAVTLYKRLRIWRAVGIVSVALLACLAAWVVIGGA